MLKPESCNGCPLVSISDGFSESEGDGTSGVAIIGEALGYNEYLDGLPFRPHAQAGSKLEEVFRLVSRDTGKPCTRSQFKIGNMIWCHPPGDKLAGTSYEQKAVSCCSCNLDRCLDSFHTGFNKTILALGNIPLKYLTGVSGIAEEKQSISHLNGFVFPSKYGLVVPSYHPSYIKRGNGHLTPLLVEHMKRALGVAQGGYSSYESHSSYKPPVYQVSPGLDEAWSFYNKVRDNSRLVLSYDIETAETGSVDENDRDELESAEIVLVQFSIGKGSGIAFPFTEDYIDIIRKLFMLPNPKGNHNTWNFDNPRLRAKGIGIEGYVHDTMWMFKHFYPKLPRGLQNVAGLFGFPFPWKHLYNTSLQWYGCADVDAVQWILHVLPKLMKARGVWEGYVRHVYRVHPILDRASVVGLPVDEGKRVGLEVKFKEERKKIHEELQRAIPDELRNIRPKRKLENGGFDYGYKREPKIVGEEFERYTRLSEILKRSGKKVRSYEDFLYRKHGLAYAEFKGTDEGTGLGTNIKRWCVIEEFRASQQQLVRYLKWRQERIRAESERVKKERDEKYGGRNIELTRRINELLELADDYEVPISLKTKRETTSKQELEEMFINTNDVVLEKVVRIRSYDTNINNYLPNWRPSKDGRVHTTWGFTAPSGQFDARRPNILNCSKHTEFGNEFRGIIEAPNGRIFVEFDKKSFHVGTLGYCANDKGYIRFSQLDPHSILGSYIAPDIIGGSISLKWSDEEIMEASREFKKRSKAKGKELHGCDIRQQLAKPTVLGNQLELGPKKLQRQNRRFIEFVYERERIQERGKGYSAEGLQSLISGMFPKCVAYKQGIKEKAHIEKFLINEFGRINYFYDVFNFNYNKKTRNWVKKDGDGARDPIAWRVQGTAFGMITEEILKMEEEGLCEEHQFMVSIHDSVVMMPEKRKLDRCMEDVSRIMNRPCRQLVNEATGPEGLVIRVECSVGPNWKEMEEVKI